MYLTQVRFDILRVRVPKGVFSESGKIWNRLEQEVLPAQTALLLQKNGLRVARGKLEDWRPIRALLDAEPHVTTGQNAITMNNGLPLLLELHAEPRDQLLFLYRPGGTLVGAPFRMSTNVLRIEYSVPLHDADALEIEMMPEIQLQHLPSSNTLRRPDELAQVPVPPGRILRELAFRITLQPGEFVTVGPSPAANEIPYVAGALLLCDELDGKRYESMFFITPQVSQTGRSDGS